MVERWGRGVEKAEGEEQNKLLFLLILTFL